MNSPLVYDNFHTHSHSDTQASGIGQWNNQKIMFEFDQSSCFAFVLCLKVFFRFSFLFIQQLADKVEFYQMQEMIQSIASMFFFHKLYS